jgi:hypothetical protein
MMSRAASSIPVLAVVAAAVLWPSSTGRSDGRGGGHDASPPGAIAGGDSVAAMPPCLGDCANADLQVDIEDLLALLGQWGGPGSCDLVADGLIDIQDLLALFGSWGPCTVVAPINDKCIHSIEIFNGDTPFETIGATTDGPAHALCQFDGQTYHDIWFDYIATDWGELEVYTCNQAAYDTDIVVYDGCDCDNLVLLGCNDDGVGCANFTSYLPVPVNKGECYKIRIGGWQEGSFGTGIVTVDDPGYHP